MAKAMNPDPDALAAFWRCLRETREAVNVRERPVGAGFWWWYHFTNEHEIFDGGAFGRN